MCRLAEQVYNVGEHIFASRIRFPSSKLCKMLVIDSDATRLSGVDARLFSDA